MVLAADLTRLGWQVVTGLPGFVKDIEGQQGVLTSKVLLCIYIVVWFSVYFLAATIGHKNKSFKFTQSAEILLASAVVSTATLFGYMIVVVSVIGYENIGSLGIALGPGLVLTGRIPVSAE